MHHFSMRRYLKVVFLLWSVSLLNLVNAQEYSKTPVQNNNKEEVKRKFTHEWQEIGEDEPIPPGLHVRINLSTHKKEVKLLDEYESKPPTSVAVVEKANAFTDEGSGKSALENRLKNIPMEDKQPTVEEIEKVKKKFRPYEELKKEFENLKMSVKTDLEVMNDLFANYQKLKEKQKTHTMGDLGDLNILSPLEESHLGLLTDLEYMVHQVDNAREFVSKGGLNLIVYPSLNSSSSVIRSEAARLLGSAVQNNAASQIKALESGAVGILLRLLALDTAANVRSSALYALGCLVRRFPLAQRQFVDQGGLTVLISLFDGETGEQLKLQVKVVTFIDDLVIERQDAKMTQLEALSNNDTSSEKHEAEERLRQYKQINLEDTLQEQQWCQHLVKLLKRELLSKSMVVVEEHVENSPDLDVVEKLTRAMLSLSKPCQTQFLADPQVQKLILGLIQWLKGLAQGEVGETDGYYTGLANQVKLLASHLGFFHATHSLFLS